MSEVPPVVLQTLQSSGQPLDRATRTFMETGFSQDFSQVRVHTDASATESARGRGADKWKLFADHQKARGSQDIEESLTA